MHKIQLSSMKAKRNSISNIISSLIGSTDVRKSKENHVVEEPTCCPLVAYVFKFFDGSLKNSFSRQFLTYVFALTIIVGFICSFMQTVPSFKLRPSTCPQPACNNDPELCPGYMICEPITAPVFDTVDRAVICIFTIEYGVKILTVWAVSARVAEIIPSSWEGTDNDPAPVYPLYEHYLRFVFTFKNIVDLVTVLPYYIGLITGGKNKGQTFLRVFRLLRIFKLLRKFKEAQIMFNLIVATMVQSMPALAVLVLFLCMGTIFFGSLIYAVECGTFTVNENYPQGEYLRPTVSHFGVEVSPFNSIPNSIYWVITTFTTIGYGDLVPTSWIGRMLACVVMLTGLLVLALPVGVVGTNFSDLYKEFLLNKVQEAEEAEELLRTQVGEAENRDLDLDLAMLGLDLAGEPRSAILREKVESSNCDSEAYFDCQGEGFVMNGNFSSSNSSSTTTIEMSSRFLAGVRATQVYQSLECDSPVRTLDDEEEGEIEVERNSNDNRLDRTLNQTRDCRLAQSSRTSEVVGAPTRDYPHQPIARTRGSCKTDGFGDVGEWGEEKDSNSGSRSSQANSCSEAKDYHTDGLVSSGRHYHTAHRAALISQPALSVPLSHSQLPSSSASSSLSLTSSNLTSSRRLMGIEPAQSRNDSVSCTAPQETERTPTTQGEGKAFIGGIVDAGETGAMRVRQAHSLTTVKRSVVSKERRKRLLAKAIKFRDELNDIIEDLNWTDVDDI